MRDILTRPLNYFISIGCRHDFDIMRNLRISLYAKRLAEAGFAVGERIDVEVSENELVMVSSRSTTWREATRRL